MIWNDEILFLHVPKTGGSSATFWLARNLTRPVHYTAPKKMRAQRKAKFHRGMRHESLAEASDYFARAGRTMDDFTQVFAVMRNPYDLDVSRFHHLLRKGPDGGQGPEHQLAMDRDFAGYLAQAPLMGYSPPQLDRFFHIAEGPVPSNLRPLRFESLAEDLVTNLAPYLHEDADPRLGHINKSEHQPWEMYYDRETELLTYARHQWFFDEGYYPRLTFE